MLLVRLCNILAMCTADTGIASSDSGDIARLPAGTYLVADISHFSTMYSLLRASVFSVFCFFSLRPMRGVASCKDRLLGRACSIAADLSATSCAAAVDFSDVQYSPF